MLSDLSGALLGVMIIRPALASAVLRVPGLMGASRRATTPGFPARGLGFHGSPPHLKNVRRVHRDRGLEEMFGRGALGGPRELTVAATACRLSRTRSPGPSIRIVGLRLLLMTNYER